MLAKLFKRSSQRTDTLPIQGLDTQANADALCKQLSQLPGIQHASVTISPAEARLSYDTAQLSLAQIKAVVTTAGFSIANNVHGEDTCCGGCTD